METIIEPMLDAIIPVHEEPRPNEAPIAVSDTNMGVPIVVGTNSIPRMSLFPAISMEKDDAGVEQLCGALLYGIIPGIHIEKLPSDAPKTVSLDGFEVLGYRDPILNAHTRGSITIIPLMHVKDNKAMPLPLPAYPGDTSLETAAKLANDKSWAGIMPFAVTGANDVAGRILPNFWSAEKRKYLKNYDITLAGNSKDCNIQVSNIGQVLEYLHPSGSVIDSSKCITYTPKNHMYNRTVTGVYCADDQLTQILTMLQSMNSRLSHLEGGAPAHHGTAPPVPAPRTSLPRHSLPDRKAVGWLHHVDTVHPGTWDKLDQFADRDPTGRKFTTLLSNSTPSYTVGPTQQQNQSAKAQRIYDSMIGMGIRPDQFDIQWIMSNGARGPTTHQIAEFRRGVTPAPSPTASNEPGEVKAGTVVSRVDTSSIDPDVVQMIAENALSVQFATPQAMQRVREMMADNGGKGLNQQQMQTLRNEFKPKGTTRVTAVRPMPMQKKRMIGNVPIIPSSSATTIPLPPPLPKTPPPKTVSFRSPAGVALD